MLNCFYNQIQWQALQSLLKYCSWILPYENIYIVCDRLLHCASTIKIASTLKANPPLNLPMDIAFTHIMV
ncbi:MAG: hypothetical protein V7L25_30110 [Nostoc sp.]|uniref:hypothetical protein n=1 Tax=Nostoc sp. TaxID=1180 RepID=UPI002FF986CE